MIIVQSLAKKNDDQWPEGTKKRKILVLGMGKPCDRSSLSEALRHIEITELELKGKLNSSATLAKTTQSLIHFKIYCVQCHAKDMHH